jgi:hypothetical protein
MQVITNEKLIKNRARLGRGASFAGLAVLVLGLVASLSPHRLLTPTQWLLVSFSCLFAGFVLSQIGLYNANRWVKEPRPDQTLVKVMKGFDDRYHLYNYVLKTPHVLLAPFGLCVINPKDQGGKITCKGGKWRHEGSWRRVMFRIFGQEGLGNPAKEVRAEAEKLRRFFAQQLPGEEVPVEGVVVFTNPQVDLEVENPAVPVLDGKQFKSFLRDLSKERPISGSQRRQLAEILEAGNNGR